MEKSKNPLVSVIVTCYNHEKYIEQCIQSVYDQTYRNICLLIIDDGSTDNSPAFIEKMVQVSPFENTEFIKQSNKGICLTRNVGLDWNQADFLLFIDSDNFLENNYIEAMVEHAFKTNADIIYCDLYDFEKNKNFIISQDFNLIEFMKNNYIDNCSLIRSSIIGNIRYDENLNRKFLVDYDFLLNLVLNNHAKPSYCNNTRLNYRVLEDSISRRDGHQDLKYYYDVYTYILNKHLKTYPDDVYEAVKENLFTISDRLTELVDHQIELEPFIQSLKGEVDELNQRYFEKNAECVRISQRTNQLFYDNQALVNSTSYRLGNALIKPLYLARRAIHNPRLILKAGRRGQKYLTRKLHQLPRPTMYYNRFVKDLNRNKNQVATVKRFLIYVIFEEQNDVQEYKYLFLDHLAKFASKVLIISNSQLNDRDMRHLSRYGEVKIRENQGYDTAAFRQGILDVYADLKTDYSELILANDTSIGPIVDFSDMFAKMDAKTLDFWGITFGEEQEDITGYNRYNFIPKHLQSYFLSIRRNMFLDSKFMDYWENLTQTNSREEAIGRHETVFTKYFADMGYRYDAYVQENSDSAMYIHPLKMIKLGVPLIKYSALANFDDEQFIWQGLQRQSEIPELVKYINHNSQYPVRIIHNIIEDIKNKQHDEYILIIDGVQNIIPQCTRYRVLNKKEYLETHGYKVKVVNLSDFQLKDIRYASTIIVYRAPYTPILDEMILLAHKRGTKVYFDIDDLVIDTKYTDLLEYTQQLDKFEKQNYDASVNNYARMLQICDGVITSTNKMADELKNYKDIIYLDRNIASNQLVQLSKFAVQNKEQDNTLIKIGYFSGSITHNENFNLIKDDLLQIMNEFHNVELHLVGYIELPQDFMEYKKRVVFHDYVDWKELPKLISQVDINLAPLKKSIFNEAKSEIKWIEASLVKVVTVASDIGSFKDMIQDGQTGILCTDNQWFDKLKTLIINDKFRESIAINAYQYVLQNCTTDTSNSAILQLLGKGE